MSARERADSELRPQPSGERPRVLVLTTSLLTDRMLLYTDFLPTLGRVADVTIWASSQKNPSNQEAWNGMAGVRVEPFPEVGHYPQVPHNYLRRLNDFVWDFRLGDPSRQSVQKHLRDRAQPASIRALRFPARVLARAGAAEPVEAWTERVLRRVPRSPEARRRLESDPFDLVVTTGPFWFWEPAVVAAAKNLGIPVAALIPSWDNLSTKNRMVFRYDAYFVWSDEAKRQLHDYYPESRGVPVHIVGAPQFDVFFQKRFHRSRKELCETYGLRADAPLIVYAVGSPNFLQEHHGAVDLARRLARGELGDSAQMLVRPHPIHDDAGMTELFREFGPRVAVQRTADPRASLTARSQNAEQVADWVNTFRHADAVVNLSSTVTIDAAILDRPVVNLDYDPQPGGADQRLVHDINHLWTHFRPVAESGGVWLTKSPEETAHAVRTYLDSPELHRDARRWMAEYVCGPLDGQSGGRWGASVGRVLESLRSLSAPAASMDPA